MTFTSERSEDECWMVGLDPVTVGFIFFCPPCRRKRNGRVRVGRKSGRKESAHLIGGSDSRRLHFERSGVAQRRGTVTDY